MRAIISPYFEAQGLLQRLYLAYLSQGKGFSDSIENILCLWIQFPPQIPESHSDRTPGQS